ncbi:MAG: arginine--tRNA ligase, partial [Akkermansiaceae bacterium]
MMMQELEEVLSRALDAADLDLPENFQVQLEASADLRFGDYQSNVAMVLAKQLRTNPRELASRLIELMQLGELATAEIAGPGFINFRILKSAWSREMASL